MIGEDVIGFNHINYIRVAPAKQGKQGCDWVSVYCLDVGGLVPNEFLNKLAGSQLKQGEAIIKQII